MSAGRPARSGRVVVAVWLLMMASAAVVVARASYVADLSAFLPTAPTPGQRVLLAQLRDGVAARVLLIGIDGGDAPLRADVSRRMAAALDASGRFAAVDNGDRDNPRLRRTGELLFAHRYLLSPAVSAQRFSVEGLRAAFDDTVSLLGTPAGGALQPLLWRDPTGETAQVAEAVMPVTAPRLEAGVWSSRTAPRALLVATTLADGADLDGQERAIAAVQEAFAARPPAAATLRLTVSGQGAFGVEARARIHDDVERLALAGAAGVAVLLWLAFGSMRALGVGALPVASGMLAGIAAVAVVCGPVHGLTLGFGTTLIGESVDYAIYFLLQARRPAGRLDAADGAAPGYLRWRRDDWPTVRLGLCTSLAGFAALLLSGFPGLVQLGVYSVAGLIAAAATTVHLLPVLAPDGADGRGWQAALGRLAAGAARAAPSWRWPLAVISGVCALAAVLQPQLWQGSLAALSPIAADSLARDAALRADLGAVADAGRLVAIEAPDEATALSRAEAAGARLDALVARGAVLGYTSPAHWLPSTATQAARRAALPDATTLRENVRQAAADGPLPASKLQPFIDDVEAARRLPPLTRATYDGTPIATALQAQLSPPRRSGDPWTALMSVQTASAPTTAPTALDTALAGLPGTRLVAVQAELDALYAHYLHRALLQSLLGAGAVLLLLATRLRNPARLARVTAPLVASVATLLGGAATLGAALGVLHLVALLLVVAVGSNYALFFDNVRHGAGHAEGTLASLALANLTVVLSFGLLATSSVPALSAVGRIVAPGAVLALVLSAAFIGEPRPRSHGVGHSPRPLPRPHHDADPR